MNIFKQELKLNIKSSFFWGVGISLMIIVSCYKVSGMNSIQGGFAAMIESMPPIIKVMMGGGANFDTPVGIYGVIHVYIALALAMHAVLLGSLIFYRELRDHTFEFLYTLGVERRKIITMKCFSGIFLMLILNTVAYIVTCISISFCVGNTGFFDLFPFFVVVFIAQFCFFCLGLFLSMALKKSHKAGSYGCIAVLVMLLIDYYVKLGGNDALSLFTIFSYIDHNSIQQAFPFGFCLVALIICLISLELVIKIHNKKDLN